MQENVNISLLASRFSAIRRPAGIITCLFLCGAPWSAKWTHSLYFLESAPWQIWRFVTAHMTHWSWPHLVNNLISSVCFLLLYDHFYEKRSLIARIILLILVFSGYFSIFYVPSFYLGASALLYSLFIYSAIRFWSLQPIINTGVILYCLYMSVYKPMPMVDIGVPVAYSAHQFGIMISVVLVIFEVGAPRLHKFLNRQSATHTR